MDSESVDFNYLVFASLFHDIGKFYQRSGLKHDRSFDKYSSDDYGFVGAHSKWSADFINEKFNNNDISNLVFYHHNPTGHDNSELCYMLSMADHHSAIERIKSDSKKSPVKEPLISIFSEINLENNDYDDTYYLRLNELSLDNSFDNIFPKNKKELISTGYNLKPEYKRLWLNFINEFDSISNLYDFNTVLCLLRKYTSYIPSAVYTSNPDISLYDHSKTTAAIAGCRYLFNKETNDLTKTSDKQEVYLVATGDISGIQQFIYNIASPQNAQKGMSKRLRGRSLYLSLLSDAIVNRLINDLSLTNANILFVGGGRFTIIAPNTDSTKNILNDIKYLVNDYFIDNFNAELYFSLEYIECSGDDLHDFGTLTEKLSSKVSENKKHKFINHLDKVFEVEDSVKYGNSCAVCGNLTEDTFCDECKSHEKLGRSASNADYMIKCFSQNDLSFDIFIEPVRIGYLFEKDSGNLVNEINRLSSLCDKIEVSKINDTNFLDYSSQVDKSNVSFTFSFLANTVPVSSDIGTLSFEHLAKLSKGSDKLGVLKMDVDNLGLIFSKGFTSEEDDKMSISRVSTLSSYMDFFFSGLINKIASEYKVYVDECSNGIELNSYSSPRNIKVTRNKSDNSSIAIPTIHINYSGGDDLLIIGPYDDILDFSLNIRNKFKKWTCCNPSINISGGISVVNYNFPIRKSVKIADENLDKSKSCGKDKITLFKEILNWDSDGLVKGYDDILNFSFNLEDYVNKNYISKSFVYSLLNLWEYSFHYENKINNIDEWNEDIQNNRLKHKSYVHLFRYKLRNIEDRNIRNEINKEGIKYMPWIKIPVSWVSLRTR